MNETDPNDAIDSKNPDAQDDQLANLLRELEERLPGSESLDWRETTQRGNEILGRFYRHSVESQRLTEAIWELEPDRIKTVGAEHLLIGFEEHSERYFKSTFGGSFGCRSMLYRNAPDNEHFHASANPCARFYLKRWSLLNSMGQYKTRLEGVLPPDGPHGPYRICVSQPALPLENPTDKQIELAMENFGFLKVCENTFFQSHSGILLTDAAPRNVRVLDGILVPFDAIAENPSPATLDWIKLRLKL